jgi:hypothetical protein
MIIVQQKNIGLPVEGCPQNHGVTRRERVAGDVRWKYFWLQAQFRIQRQSGNSGLVVQDCRTMTIRRNMHEFRSRERMLAGFEGADRKVHSTVINGVSVLRFEKPTALVC